MATQRCQLYSDFRDHFDDAVSYHECLRYGAAGNEAMVIMQNTLPAILLFLHYLHPLFNGFSNSSLVMH